MGKIKKCEDCEVMKKEKISECASCGQKYKLIIIKNNDKEKTTRNK